MQIVDVSQAVGMILGQDLTRIVPGEFKGVAFKKGHIIKAEDISMLRSMGKNNIYVMEIKAGDIHENDGAHELAKMSGKSNLIFSEPAEGKVSMKAPCRGVLKIDSERLLEVNMLDGLVLSTLHNDSIVEEGELVASAKIIPLLIAQATIDIAKGICTEPLIQVIPLGTKKAGLIITGNEVYHGIIEDKFAGVISKKLLALGSEVTKSVILPDDADLIAENIKMLAEDNDIVVVTGGMSVDPDDVTPVAISKAGATVAVYGTPVLPGAMFMAAYLDEVTILGIPACGMFSKITVLDVVLPKVLSGEKITKRYMASLGHGGLCRQCTGGCHYPNCSFAK